ncbi:MAG: DegT/DnrJ/EryC1/StrS family aminotransferase [bacterium]
MNVPLLDIKAQLAPLRDDILKAITEVVDSTQYIMGPKVAELEERIAAYCNAKHAVGVTSGTDALLISLMALGVGPGDVVITTPYSFFATAGVIARLHAQPVFVDIDPVTYNLDPALLREALEKGVTGDISKRKFSVSRVKAIIPVHLYGQCADMSGILDVAAKYNVPVIEDAAQAIGAEYPMPDGTVRKAGTMAAMGCFSFFPSKNLGCMGDGGMVVTQDDALADKLRILRVHGGKPKYYHKIIGGNFRLDPMQAAILLVKLPYLNQWHKARQKNADHYDGLMQEAGMLTDGLVTTPKRVYKAGTGSTDTSTKSPRHAGLEYDHIFNQYVIRVNDRDKLRAFLKDKGIGTEVYYPVPFHLQECFFDLAYREGDFPESESAAKHTVALPIYPELSKEQQAYVVECVAHFCDR